MIENKNCSGRHKWNHGMSHADCNDNHYHVQICGRCGLKRVRFFVFVRRGENKNKYIHTETIYVQKNGRKYFRKTPSKIRKVALTNRI